MGEEQEYIENPKRIRAIQWDGANHEAIVRLLGFPLASSLIFQDDLLEFAGKTLRRGDWITVGDKGKVVKTWTKREFEKNHTHLPKY